MDRPLVESATIRKISWRLLPLIVVGYCVAYINRSNVAFAALTMNKDLGLTPYIYGTGAGIFFLGYFIFEIPSNVFLERVGARRWIARIMATWAITSALAAFATGPASFLTIRFLLGVAEAGFFPGVVLYCTYWYPSRYRARVTSALFLAQPIANSLASVLSGAILGMDGLLGFKGWQWVFIIEALPALVLACFVLKYLTERPGLAAWLQPDEKAWLETELNEERRAIERSRKMSLRQALFDSRVLILALIYFLATASNYGIVFFLPQIVKGMGLSNFGTGVASATPYVVGSAGLLLWGWSSDRSNERRWHYASAAAIGALGLAIAGWFGSSIAGLAGITLAVAGIYGSRTAFWPMPSLFLTGTAAAGAIAQINATGNLGGYLGPFAVGWIKDSTNSFESGLYFLAGCSLASGIVALLATRVSKPQN